MHRIPPPDVRELLLPFLSCLPTAFISPRPPPAFLPLLSPILRQRVHLRDLSSNNVVNWLTLLTWSPSRGARLVEIISNLQLEPHPVSGELELFEDDVEGGEVKYRRLDSETLQAKCGVQEHNLGVIWVWCENDTGATGVDSTIEDTQSGWRISEVLPLESDYGYEAENPGTGPRWCPSMSEAEQAMEAQSSNGVSHAINGNGSATTADQDEEDDDDDYWASYDRSSAAQTPAARTPAKQTPVPGSSAPQPMSAEDEYYARYGQEVQPALDGHDPDEQVDIAQFEPTRGPHHGRHLRANGTTSQSQPPPYDAALMAAEYHNWQAPAADEQANELPTITAATALPRIHSPTPSRPSSSSGGRRSPDVSTLEAEASAVSAAEVGVKQHISTELKSLYRLARSIGIEREEFERVVKTGLECLGMMDQ